MNLRVTQPHNLKPEEHEIVQCCAEAEGAPALDFSGYCAKFKFFQQRIDESDSDGWFNNPTRPKSTIAAEVYARLSTAIQRGNADGVINWRYAECGEAIHDADTDPVRAALNSPAIDLAQCDKDLRMRRWAAGAGGAAAGAGGAAAGATAAAEAGEGSDGPSAAVAAGLRRGVGRRRRGRLWRRRRLCRPLQSRGR